MQKRQDPIASRKKPELPANIDQAIRQLAASEASLFKSSYPDDRRTEEQLRNRFEERLRGQAEWLLPLFDTLDGNPHYEKLVELGCDGPTLTRLLGSALAIPKEATPPWDALVGNTLESSLKRISKVAIEIQFLISHGGLEFVPEDLRPGIDDLPVLLHNYCVALTHIRKATNKKTIRGPRNVDRRALNQIHQYVKETTGKSHPTAIIGLLDAASHNKVQIDPRVYRRFRKPKTHPNSR
jgi:hypothetical protein